MDYSLTRVQLKRYNEQFYFFFDSWMQRFRPSAYREHDQQSVSKQLGNVSRFLGYQKKYSNITSEQEMVQKARELIDSFMAALKKWPDTQDLMEMLNATDFGKRMELFPGLWVRQTKDEIRFSLRRIEHEHKRFICHALVPVPDLPGNQQQWEDNIQFSWDIDSGKIEMPF